MTLPTDPAANLAALIRCASVTPAEGGALGALEDMLKPLGFSVERPVFSEDGTPDIENLYARRSGNGPHLMFAGHTDVVPVGDEASWTHPPFAAEIANGEMFGRGAVDMKGGIACFIAAVARHVETNGGPKGSVSLLITGDEEGPAINGTTKLLEWAAARGETWDASIVGEPTNPDALGDMIKIGRRGSMSGSVIVNGRQGHVSLSAACRQSGARADEPGRRLAAPGLRQGHQGFPADQSGGDLHRCRQSGDQRHSGEGDSHLQHPLQRHLDGRDRPGRNPQPPRPGGQTQEIPDRPKRRRSTTSSSGATGRATSS